MGEIKEKKDIFDMCESWVINTYTKAANWVDKKTYEIEADTRLEDERHAEELKQLADKEKRRLELQNIELRNFELNDQNKFLERYIAARRYEKTLEYAQIELLKEIDRNDHRIKSLEAQKALPKLKPQIMEITSKRIPIVDDTPPYLKKQQAANSNIVMFNKKAI